jgi:hypothetical protein
MRSVYAKVLLWCFGTLVFSLLAFAVIGAAGAVRAFGHGGPFEKTSTWQLREAREAYESGGAPKLQDYQERVDRHFGAEHHLTDIAGKDLVTGEDRSAWLTQKQPRPMPWPFGMFRDLGHRGEVHVAVSPASASVPYHWTVVLRPGNYDPWTFLPYYLLVFVALGLLCWLLAVNLATPLRSLARTVDRFGRGDASHGRTPLAPGHIARVAHAPGAAELCGGVIENGRRPKRGNRPVEKRNRASDGSGGGAVAGDSR